MKKIYFVLLAVIVVVFACSKEEGVVEPTVPIVLTVEGEGTVKEEVIGTTVRLTATPNAGWVFIGWSGSVESKELVIEVPNEEGTVVSALFKRDSFKLNITIEGEGTVKEEVIVQTGQYEEVIEQSGQYDYGTVVRLTAIPSDNWSVFKEWRGDISSENESIAVEVNNALNVNAFFENVNIKVKTKRQTLQLTQIGLSPEELRQTLMIVSGPFYYSDSNSSYMLFPGQANWVAGRPDLGIQSITDENRVPTFSFIKQDGIWVFHKSFPEAGFWGPRHFEIRGNTFFINDGNEIGDQWKGDLFMGEILDGGDIDWTRVNSDEEMSYYHGLGVGDLNGDGLLDAGIAPGQNRIQIFYQENDRSFTMDTSKLKVLSRMSPGEAVPFTLQIKDLDNDTFAEIITASYGSGNPATNQDLNDIRIYKLNRTIGEYEEVFTSKIPIQNLNIGLGATSIKVLDVNTDGLDDLLIAREGFYNQQNVNSFEVWLGVADLKFNFKYISPVFTEEELMFREFLMFDVNNDGLDDLILRPHSYGSLYRIVPNTYNIVESSGVKLNHLIWINQGDGTFSHYDSENLEVEDILTYNLFPYMEDNVLHFMGIYPFMFPNPINSGAEDIITSDIAVKIKN